MGSISDSAAGLLRARRCGAFRWRRSERSPPHSDPKKKTDSLCLAHDRFAKRPIAPSFGHPESIQHPVDRVTRHAQELRRAMAIALRRLQRANQRQLGGLTDDRVKRVEPGFLGGAVGLIDYKG